MYDITGSIVTYNTNIGELDQVINSFFKTNLRVKLFISDNSPTDKLREYFKNKNYENIEYNFNNYNGGYGWGHNRILKKIKNCSKYHIVLNSDIYFDDNVLEELFIFMERNQDIGNVMPKVKYPNGEIQYICKRNPRPLNIILRSFNLQNKIFKNMNYLYEMRDKDYNNLMDVEILSGCFMFLRNSIFETIGYFDENIFMYFEDFDYNRRIRCQYKTIYYPYVEIIHNHARQAHKDIKMFFIALRSAIYYFNKWGWR